MASQSIHLNSKFCDRTVGFNARNKDLLGLAFLCRICSLILRDPVQLLCGHRQCKSCVESIDGEVVKCPEYGIKPNQEILHQDVASLKQKVEDMQYISYDGTLIWKITAVKEKMIDAQSERQTSIYSPPFYSSPIGYKMRARLYLNGDGNARRTHLSLFFVLMRSKNDALLKFPFNYKVTFCLYDQTPAQRHIIDSFRPDIKSNSFQRPRSEMNIASGIPKFFPLAMIEQEGNPYVRDDTMFIKIMVDFGDIPKTLLPYALSLNSGLPAYIQQILIKQEAERRAQQTPIPPDLLRQHTG
ncbi:unnamed protein product [Rotaria sordida]|uniref:RING-type domain-containing protein n=1 Tax=Rotaria sordida TaxID=392033 RepID=A0A814TCP7_9BILA|nr:unnamed protein product [Rotaria sordida]